MLNYQLSGSGKTKLILLHGFMENLSIWDEMEQQLSPEFTLIKIDLPGHGLSGLSENHTMEAMAKEVQKVAEHLGLEKFHLLGHSMGGYVSLAFAEEFPELLLSITLFFSSFFADDTEKKNQRQKSLRNISEAFQNYVNAGIPNLFSANEKDILEAKINLAKDIALSTNRNGVLNAVQGMMERTDKSQLINTFQGKILILCGKHDTAVNSKKIMENVPDKTNVKSYLLDCGHNGHWEKPSICAEIINTELLHNLPKSYLF